MANERDACEYRGSPTDPSLEFDLFEGVRVRLAETFVEGGHSRIAAERIALRIVNGIRGVPRLLKVICSDTKPTHAEILDALGTVLDHADSLTEAKRLLLGVERNESE